MTPILFATALGAALGLAELAFWGFGALFRLFGGVAR